MRLDGHQPRSNKGVIGEFGWGSSLATYANIGLEDGGSWTINASPPADQQIDEDQGCIPGLGS
jgi:hypothetical protein